MQIIKCPKCNTEFKADIAKSISDDGEVFLCPNCQMKLRFVEK